METCKVKTINLLREIKDVCEAEQIRYFVSGELALCENRNKEIKDEFNNGTVAVFAGDIKRLAAVLKKRKDRKVEDLSNNSKFPGFYVRYMDTSTTLINFSEKAFTYETNSMGINIEIICGSSHDTIRGKVLSVLKKAWCQENTAYYIKHRDTRKRTVQYAAGLILKIAKHTQLMKKLFDAWIREGSTESKSYELAVPGGSIIKYSADMFENTAQTSYIGAEFVTVENLREFTRTYFNGRTKMRPVTFDICDLQVPWEQFSKSIRQNGIPLTKYQIQEQKFLSWRSDNYFPMRSIRRKNYSYMFCSEDRMLMYKEFDGDKKQQVMSLYKREDYDKLRVYLEEYIETINKYARHKIGFCSDHEIFEAALCVMLHDALEASKTADEFRKTSNKICRIVQYVDYRHFDSVENVFWGEREDAEILKARKAQLLDKMQKKAEEYYEQY